MVAINKAYEIAPEADALYACDYRFWKTCFEDGCFDFKGDLWSQVHKQQPKPHFAGRGIKYFTLTTNSTYHTKAPWIGAGNNGGFQALNAVYHTGCRDIVLLGYDMHAEGGMHFHGDHKPPLMNPDTNALRNWNKHFNEIRTVLQNLGVSVKNSSPNTRLTAFPKVQLKDALE